MNLEFDSKLLREKLIYKRCIVDDITLKQVSEQIGVSPPTLHRLEHGGIPDVITLYKVCFYIREPMELFFYTKKTVAILLHYN